MGIGIHSFGNKDGDQTKIIEWSERWIYDEFAGLKPMSGTVQPLSVSRETKVYPASAVPHLKSVKS